MTREARLMSGIILITVPTIQYGGYFLLTSLMNKNSGYMDNPLRQNFFRAGHAHAGVIVLLSLICQMLADSGNTTHFAPLAGSSRSALGCNPDFGRILLFRASPDCNSTKRSGFSDLSWRSDSCRIRRFARCWVTQICLVRP